MRSTAAVSATSASATSTILPLAGVGSRRSSSTRWRDSASTGSESSRPRAAHSLLTPLDV